MAATDSYRLSYKETPIEGEVPELEAIVPARALEEVRRLATAGDTLELGVQENQVLFGVDGTWLTTRRIEGQFPKFDELRPKEFTHEVVLPREELLEVVRRTSVMAHRNSPLRLRFAEGEVTVWTQTQDVGEARETLPIRFDGEPLEIGFNADFLRDGIESAEGDEMRLRLIDPLRPGPDPGAGRRLLVPDHADPPRRLIVESVFLANFRSYARLELALEPGLVLAVGPNGAGKTNLLESLHVGTQGFSPRTRSDAELIRFGESAARIRLEGRRGQTAVRIGVALSTAEGKRAELDGARLRAAEQLRSETATLVFTPDRLAIVKAGPAARRAYFDRSLSRLLPARSNLPADYAAALAQRNAALKFGDRTTIAPWTDAARRPRRGPGRGASRAARAAGRLVCRVGRRARAARRPARVRGRPAAREGELEARLERDLERGSTGAGPASARRLDRVRRPRPSLVRLPGRAADGRARAAPGRGGAARPSAATIRRCCFSTTCSPSSTRNAAACCSSRSPVRGQTLITATTADALPGEPAQLLEVSPGAVVAR